MAVSDDTEHWLGVNTEGLVVRASFELSGVFVVE